MRVERMQTTSKPSARGQLAAKLRSGSKGAATAQPKPSPTRKRAATRRPDVHEGSPPESSAVPQTSKHSRRSAAKRGNGNGADAGAASASTPKSTPKKRKSSPTAAVVTLELREKGGRIRRQLDDLYSVPPIPLSHDGNFQLLIAVMLSAQVRAHCEIQWTCCVRTQCRSGPPRACPAFASSVLTHAWRPCC